MKIRTKLQLIVVLCVATVATLATILFLSLEQAQKVNQEVLLAEKIASNIIEQRIVADEYLLYHADRSKEQWQAKDVENRRLLQSAISFRNNVIDDFIAELSKRYEDARSLFLQIVRNHEAPTERDESSVELEKRLASQVLIETQSMVSLAFEIANENRALLAASQKIALILTGLCLFVFTALLGAIIFLFQRSVVSPLKILDEGTRVIAGGDLAHRVGIQSSDEIGDLASSFNTMAQKLGESIANLKKEQVEASNERDKLALVIEGVSDAVIALDKNNRVVLFNNAAKLLTGFTQEKAHGQTVESIFKLIGEKGEIPASDYCAKSRAKKATVYTQSAVRLLSSTAKERTVNFTCGSIAGSSDVQFIMTIHDISKELAAEKQKVQFITVAAHQMRTPLTGIKWALGSLLQKDYGAINKKQTQLLSTIHETSKALIAIINDLLDASHIEKGIFSYSFSKNKFKPFLEEVLKSVQLESSKKNIALESTIEEIPDFEFDSEKLRIAIINILENAVNYTKDGGAIHFSAKKVAQTVEVTIRDNGIGIPQEDVEHIFTKFYRAENAVRVKTAGSGLGLFFARQIVEDHGGMITLQSKIDTGTSVTVRLPLKRTS